MDSDLAETLNTSPGSQSSRMSRNYFCDAGNISARERESRGSGRLREKEAQDGTPSQDSGIVTRGEGRSLTD